MTERADRLDAARAVADALGHPDFRRALSGVTDDEGHHPIVVVDLDDTVGYAFDRVREYREAYMAVPQEDESLAIVHLEAVHPADAGESHDGGEDCPINPDTSVGMLLTFLRRVPGTHVFREVAEDLRAELIDRGLDDAELAPA